MKMKPRWHYAVAFIVLACGDNVQDAPPAGPPAAIVAVGATDRTISLLATDTLAVEVSDANGRGVGNVVVRWRIMEDVPHTLSDHQTITDDRGIARVLFRADTLSGSVTVEAQLSSLAQQSRFAYVVAPGPPVMRDTVRIALDDFMDLRQLLTDRFGNALDTAVAWRMDNSAIATTDGSVLRGLRAGATRIAANFRGVELSSVVKVVGWKMVTTGTMHSCGLLTNGRLVCFGYRHGAPAVVPAEQLYEYVSAGDSHTCALTLQGEAWCWGVNGAGQVGDGTTQPSEQPVRVATADRFTQIAAGAFNTCALRTDGAAFCWGYNLSGNVGTTWRGDTIRTPVAIVPQLRFSAISRPNNMYSCGRTTSNEVMCWGSRYSYSTGGWDWFVPTPPPWTLGFSNASTLALGHSWSACASTNSGEVECWGYNDWGQFGTGSDENVVGAPVPAFGRARFVRVAIGSSFICALDSSGTTSCWGGNLYGEMGKTLSTTCTVNNLNGPSPYPCTKAPVTPAGLPPLAQIDAGGNHACGVTADGHLWCWGNYSAYQTGVKNPWAHAVPVDAGWIK